MSQLLQKSFQWILTPAGKLTGKAKDGNDGSSGTFSWKVVPDFLNKQEGGSFSVDLVANYLIKTLGGSVTYSVLGSLPPGWSLDSAGVLAFSGTGQGAATIQVKGVLAGSPDAITNSFNVSSIAAGATDLTAPTVPTGTECVVVAGAGVTVSCDPAMDPKIGSTIGGLKEYRLHRDGVFVHAVSASSGIAGQLVHSVLTTGGSTLQSGSDYTFTSAGDGFGGSSDTGEFAFLDISGDFELVTKVVSITGGNTNSNVSLHVREDLTGTAKMVVLAVNGVRTRMRYRATVGASASIAGSVDGQLAPVWLKLVRAGSTFTSYYSTTGRAWTSFASSTVAMSSAVKAGILVGTGGSGTTVTAGVEQFKVSQNPAISYLDPVTDGASHTWTWKARDLANNDSASSVGVTATASGTADVTNPTIPTGLTGSGPAQDTVSWVWNPSTDASGIRGYIPSLSSDNVSFTPQPEQTDLTFGKSGLAASSTRYLKVEAVDNANNHSGFSASVSATSAAAPGADSTPPAAPTNLSATAISSTQLTISGTASSDPSGISGYRLFVASSDTGPFYLRQTNLFPVLPFNDTVGVPSTSAFYQLSAVDGAGNEGPRSAVFSGTTQPSTALTVTALHYDDMQGTYDAGKPSQPGGSSKRWQIMDDYDFGSGNPILNYSTNHARFGTQCARAELRITSSPTTWYHANSSETPFRNEWNASNGATWAPTGWNRNQVLYTPANGIEYWSGLSVYLPEVGNVAGDPAYGVSATHPSFAIVAQWHGSGESGSDIRNPMLALSTSGIEPGTGLANQWHISSLSQTTFDSKVKVYDTKKTYVIGPVAPDRGHWIDWVFRCRWDYGNNGILQVWKNDVLVVNQINFPNSFNNTNVGYPIPVGFYIERVSWPTNPNPSTIAPGMPATMVGYWGWWKYCKVVGNPQAAVDTSNPGYFAVKPPGPRPV